MSSPSYSRRRLIQGVGINDADYPVTRDSWEGGKRRREWYCPFYMTWKRMLDRVHWRCLSTAAYADTSVCEEWHRFSVFKLWMQSQDWEGKELDKDLLVFGNRCYSATTCCFISRATNAFISGENRQNRCLPVGVSYSQDGRFIASITGGGKRRHLGSYSTVKEAFFAWLDAKQQASLTVADHETDPRIKPAVIARYANYPIPDFSQYPTLDQLRALTEVA